MFRLLFKERVLQRQCLNVQASSALWVAAGWNERTPTQSQQSFAHVAGTCLKCSDPPLI